MKVIEIFDSIDGEGKFAGCLATFIRLSGCNLRCVYCDTTYAFSGGTEMSIDEIMGKVQAIGNTHVTLTGGEPLIHKDIKQLIFRLCECGYIVNIETNGAVDISEYLDMPVIITLDYKTISSGVNEHMLLDNIKQLRKQDVLKIVCCESDFSDILGMLLSTPVSASVYLSPIYGKINPVELVGFAKKLRSFGIYDVKIQLQLHKIIWKPDERGV